MARRNRKDVDEEVELDEVDAFNVNREKILLNEAGEYAQGNYSDESSEEEVMAVEEAESESEEENEGSQGEDFSEVDEDELAAEEDEEKGWGGRQNYYGGDVVSDEEDAKQMTEEAIRQQKKHLQELDMDDYVDEDMMEGWEKAADKYNNQETKQQIVLTTDSSYDKLDESEQLKLLKQSFPEFVPLLKELGQLKLKLDEFQTSEANPLIQVKSVALSAYLAAVSSYFAIFVDNLRSGEPFTSMKDNSIMETILSTREVWRQANELPDVAIERDNEEESEESGEEIFVDAREDISEEEEDEEIDEEEEEEEEVESPVEDDTIDIDVTTKRTIRRAAKNKGDGFTEADTIDDVDMEDKQRRKKTLRFYTSKIDQAAAKTNKSFSGDLDIPYKERLFERQQRLVEEARKRGLNKPADQDYDSGNDEGEAEGGDDGYYESIKESKVAKKQSRKQAHEIAVKAAKEGKLAEVQEVLGKDGKRAINYQILKNKGLTPHRKKEYRNARVKKRKQYETAKKKLKSVRQVYDASNRGPYEGEKTGIKKGLSRSVKLV
ncbi:SAS10 [[Candida] subhashii]|uniref:SAS10 n=1 Tax=[Candida] subhashii TaxID=561895 RepID=A0A8J5QV97_9ASCO|nr:SAS10 [[Candida] subhashii]KAG7665407.1 SAS10 [[Candida] subhashii]